MRGGACGCCPRGHGLSTSERRQAAAAAPAPRRPEQPRHAPHRLHNSVNSRRPAGEPQASPAAPRLPAGASGRPFTCLGNASHLRSSAASGCCSPFCIATGCSRGGSLQPALYRCMAPAGDKRNRSVETSAADQARRCRGWTVPQPRRVAPPQHARLGGSCSWKCHQPSTRGRLCILHKWCVGSSDSTATGLRRKWQCAPTRPDWHSRGPDRGIALSRPQRVVCSF